MKNNLISKISGLFKNKFSKKYAKAQEKLYSFYKNRFDDATSLNPYILIDNIKNEIKFLVDSKGEEFIYKETADAIIKDFLLLKNWKKQGLVKYDDSLDQSVDEITKELKNKKNWFSSIKCIIDSDSEYKTISYKTKIEKAQTQLEKFMKNLPKGYLSEKINDLLSIVYKMQKTVENASLVQDGNITMFSQKESYDLLGLIKALTSQSEELENLKRYYYRAKLKENKEILKKIEEEYGIYKPDDCDLMKYAKDHNLSLYDIFNRDDIFPLDILNGTINSCYNITHYDYEKLVTSKIDLFKRIKEVASKVKLNANPELDNVINLTEIYSNIAKDQKLDDILHQNQGMTSEQFEYVFNLISSNISKIIENSKFGKNITLDYKIKDKMEENQLGNCSSENYPNFEINVSKDFILNIDKNIDFSLKSLKNVEPLPLAQKQFAYLLSTLTHETAHAIDISLSNALGYFYNNSDKVHDIQKYVSFKTLNEKDILLLCTLSPSLKQILDKMEQKTAFDKCKQIVKNIKNFQYLQLSKNEHFARSVGCVFYDDILDFLSLYYANKQDIKMLNSIQAMQKDSMFINEVYNNFGNQEALFEIEDMLDQTALDLSKLHDPETIDKLCINFDLSDLSEKDVEEYSKKARSLIYGYFKNLDIVNQKKLIENALKTGNYRTITCFSVIKDAKDLISNSNEDHILEFYKNTSEPYFYDSLLDCEKKEISNIFGNKFKNPDKFKHVFDSLMKQNNVNGLISFLDNQEYFDEPQKSYDIFLKDKLTGLCDWINNLPKEQKMNKNLIKLIDALRSCLDSAIDDNFAEDLIKDETIKFLESILDSTSHKKVSNTKLLPNPQNLIEG